MPRHRPPGRLANCRPTAYGYQFYTRINGELETKHFRFVELKNGKEPTQREVDDWIGLRRAIAAGAVETPQDEQGTTFADDVRLYLAQIRTMTTYAERETDLERWMGVLGKHRDRKTITPAEVRTQLEAWRKEGYAASTCNHRRTALMHLWTVLDGKRAPNPAADVPRYREPQLPPRALSPAAIDAILAAMPSGDMKARAVLMRWTGWPQQQIRTLTPRQVNWGVAVNMSRAKGDGVEARWIPLLPNAWTALEAFRDRKLFGVAFHSWALRLAFRQAAKKARANRRLPEAVRAELQNVTPYQLRHTFGTLVAGITKDDRATMDLMIHSDIRQTHRYTGGTVAPRSAAAIAAVAEVLVVLATKNDKQRRTATTSGRKRRRTSRGKRRKVSAPEGI